MWRDVPGHWCKSASVFDSFGIVGKGFSDVLEPTEFYFHVQAIFLISSEEKEEVTSMCHGNVAIMPQLYYLNLESVELQRPVQWRC